MIGGYFLKGWPRTPNHVTLSSAEAELIAQVNRSAELWGIRSAMSDFGVESNGVVYADSSATLAIANRNWGWQTPSHQYQHPVGSGNTGLPPARDAQSSRN